MDENINEKASISTPILATKKLGMVFPPKRGRGGSRKSI